MLTHFLFYTCPQARLGEFIFKDSEKYVNLRFLVIYLEVKKQGLVKKDRNQTEKQKQNLSLFLIFQFFR